MSDELLICPFCGSKPVLCNETGWHFVYCSNGECPVEPCTPDLTSDEEAISAWNSRA